MQRQQLEFLQKWLHSKNRKPLIIRGARQVGKSTLVEYIGPMTFTEFLLALGEDNLYNFIKNYELGQKIGAIIHQRLLQLLRSYYFVGGMPEAVAIFADTRSYRQVSEVHNSIIETYREDFPKYAGSRNLNRMLNVFNFAARNVGIKVKYKNISKHDQSVTIKKDLELLTMARVISKVVHSHCTGLPLQADIEEKVYKLLFLDVGLMNAICGLNWRNISQLDDMKLINEGTIAEQFIGQHLQASLSETPNRELTYWLREGRSSNAEVDYVIALDGNIIPIEIKSGATGSLKSLHQFMGTKQAPVAIRFDASLPIINNINTTINVNKQRKEINYPLISLPLYLVERLNFISATLN